MRPDHDDDRDDPVSRWLGQLGGAEPPATLAAEVMRRVRHHARGRHHAVRPQIGGTVMARKILWGLAAAAAIVLGMYGITGFPQLDRGYEATIGAAKRYTAPQISATDVVLADTSAQQFIQSETFAALVKDPNTLRLLSDPSLRLLLADDALMADLYRTQMADLQQVAAADARLNIFADNNVRLALANEAFARAITDPGVVSALQRPEVAAAVSRNDLESAAISAEVRTEIRSFARCNECNAAIRNDVLRSQLANAAMARALRDPAAVRLLLNNDARVMLANNQLASALASDLMRNAIAHNGMQPALRDPKFADALSAAARYNARIN
jgi:hypothetical protein